MFFWTWPYFFWTLGHKKCGRLAFVFPGPCGNSFCGPGWICVGPDREGICFWHRFLFFGPVYLLCHWAGCSLDLGAFIFCLTCTCFNYRPCTGRGEFRNCDKVHARSWWCRGKGAYWNNKNVGSGGEANGNKPIHIKPNWYRKLRGTSREGKVRCWNKMSAISSSEMRGEA